MAIASQPRGLGDLPTGTVARVVRVDGARAIRLRLMEMGLLPGTTVRVVRRAPLGDPLELRLRGFSLSLRRADANAVRVDVEVPSVHGAPASEADAADDAPAAHAAERSALPA